MFRLFSIAFLMHFGPTMLPKWTVVTFMRPPLDIKNPYFSAGLLLGGPLLVLATFWWIWAAFGHPFWHNVGDFGFIFYKHQTFGSLFRRISAEYRWHLRRRSFSFALRPLPPGPERHLAIGNFDMFNDAKPNCSYLTMWPLRPWDLSRKMEIWVRPQSVELWRFYWSIQISVPMSYITFCLTIVV